MKISNLCSTLFFLAVISLSLVSCIDHTNQAATKQITSDQTTSDLILEITGFDSSIGIAKVALVNSKQNYGEEIPYKGFNCKIINNKVVKTIPGLPLGEYAVKVYHDENGNDELDTRMFGIPIEQYGFSNNARGTLGPPKFEAASFNLDSEILKIFIKIQ
ncbi:DUF2141 domain-containing protein [Desulfobacula sp.]